MKCTKCNGNGNIPRPNGTELFGLTEVMTCDLCNGTGEVEMNNEKWFCGLSTEEKAKWIADKMRHNCEDYYHENQRGSWDANYWEIWLKQPLHNE